ncbi:MAG: type II toxin-antitoxin system VapB family antitoxin [Chitinophagaceae bacterium]|nr:type II toxin-antitoxin system VapB family antitoxin [Polaromonas sp.]
MRTNIVIDDQLRQAAMSAGNFKSKKDAVEAGLRLLSRRKVYQDLRALRGKIHWTLGGDWMQPEHAVLEPRADWPQHTTPSAAAKAPE